MNATELIRRSARYGWKANKAQYVTEDKVILDFEKNIGHKPYHIYVLADLYGAVIRGYDSNENDVPLNLEMWDRHVQKPVVEA